LLRSTPLISENWAGCSEITVPGMLPEPKGMYSPVGLATIGMAEKSRASPMIVPRSDHESASVTLLLPSSLPAPSRKSRRSVSPSPSWLSPRW